MPADEIFDLADDMQRSATEVVAAAFVTFDEAGEQVVEQWGDNVRAVAPKHLPHLPDAITHETKYAFGGVSVEMGPEAGRKQGRLGRGDEFGSRNQPPHLSGLRALEAETGPLEKAAANAVERVLP